MTTSEGYATCDGVTRAGRTCTREAREHFHTDEGKCVGHYCRPHARGAGVMRMLLPEPWTYDHVEPYRYYEGRPNGLGRKA